MRGEHQYLSKRKSELDDMREMLRPDEGELRGNEKRNRSESLQRDQYTLYRKVLDKEKCWIMLGLAGLRGAEVGLMDAEMARQKEGFGEAPGGSFRGLVADAVRYWEVRRVIYNAALFAVCAIWVLATWPHFRPAIAWWAVPPMAFLALVANVCYSAAYLVEIPMQQSSMATVWKNRRWGLWAAGTVFAIVLANYWIADEIYPDVH